MIQLLETGLNVEKRGRAKPCRKSLHDNDVLSQTQMMRKMIVSFHIPHPTFDILFSLIPALSARSSPSNEKTGKRKRFVIPPHGNTKRQKDGFLSNADIDNGQKVRKPKRPRQDLNAELDDLGINMEGWTASEDASRTLRRRK